MTDFHKLVTIRRSIRAFKNDEIEPEKISDIFRAALMSPSAKALQPWHLIAVDDKMSIEKLSEAKENYIRFIAKAPLIIVVVADEKASNCWIEDASIVTATMQYQIEELGLGSCWIQIRDRYLSDGTSSEEVVRGILNIPSNLRVVCLLAVGYPERAVMPHDEDKLKWEKVHINNW